MINLADLLSKDLQAVERDELLAGVRDAEQTSESVHAWSVQLLRELRRRKVPWSTLVKETGIPQSTLWNRVNKP